MSNQARGYIAPEYWDNGITAALLNYDFSGNRVRDSYGGTSDYAYLNLKTGLNIGSWLSSGQHQLELQCRKGVQPE